MISLLFRYDDCSARSPADFERSLVAVFKNAGVSCLFGIVPQVCTGDELSPDQQEYLPLGSDRAAELREWVASGVIEPALHGCYHQNNGLVSGTPGEFAGLAVDEQLRRIREGRKLLEEALQTSVHIFIPPFNRFDEHTLQILEEERFAYLSSSLFDNAVHNGSPVQFVPHTCNIVQVETTISTLTHLGVQDAVVVPLFHPADFLEVNPERGRYTLEQLAVLLKSLKVNQNVCPLRLTDRGISFSAERFIANRSWMAMATGEAFPRLPKGTFSRTAYLSTGDAHVFMGRVRTYGRVQRGAAIVAGGVLGGGIAFLLPPVSIMPWLVVGILVFALILRRGNELAFRYQLILWFLLGMAIGGGVFS